MRRVEDALLLNIAEVSAALIGLFMVGMFFYIEIVLRRAEHDRFVLLYFRASTRIVFVLYAIPIGVSLSLVALEMVWSRTLFALLRVVLVAANVDTAVRSRGAVTATRSTLLATVEIAGTAAVVVLVVAPWVLGGLHPSREDLTWAILLAFAVGFLSICGAVLYAFDAAQRDG